MMKLGKNFFSDSFANHPMIKVGRASDSMMAPTSSYLFQLVGAGSLLSVAWPTVVQLVILFCFRF